MNTLIKKLSAAFALSFAAALCLMCLTCCSTKLSDEEKAAVGKYNLTVMTGHPNVTADSYTYSYIELKDNKKYYIENEINSTVTKQSGSWKLSGGVITFTIRSGLSKSTEKYTLENDIIAIDTTLTDDEGTVYNIHTEFKKESVAE